MINGPGEGGLQITDGFDMNYRIGSEDVRDLLNDQATKFSKYSIFNTMGCTDNAATKWGVIRT